MGPRRRARQAAVAVLFQLELQPGDWCAPLRYQLSEQPGTARSDRFAAQLVEGAVSHREEIDQAISACSRNWSLDQMGALERAVLRVAAEELLFRRLEPVPVVIDEAVELAKRLAGEEAARFVNGLLGSMARAAEPSGGG